MLYTKQSRYAGGSSFSKTGYICNREVRLVSRSGHPADMHKLTLTLFGVRPAAASEIAAAAPRNAVGAAVAKAIRIMRVTKFSVDCSVSACLRERASRQPVLLTLLIVRAPEVAQLEHEQRPDREIR